MKINIKSIGIFIGILLVISVFLYAIFRLDDKSNSNSVNREYQDNCYYSYEDGDDEFIFFNRDKLIVAGQKNTSFMLENSNNMVDAISNNTVSILKFRPATDNVETQIDDSAAITKVTSLVSIDGLNYGDYCGKLVNVFDKDEEWSFFVGTPAAAYSELDNNAQRKIDKIVSVFKQYDHMESVAYMICGKQSIQNNKTDDHIPTDDEDVTAYESSVENMLSLGTYGMFKTLSELRRDSEVSINVDEPIVCPKKIYTGQEAEELIIEYCNKTGYYEYYPCPSGCSWEVVEYTVNYKDCEYRDYINIRIKGMDGNNLKYRGIEYLSRSYDINTDQVFRAYYAVPNGCYEYCLVFGDSDEYSGRQDISSAYYHINHKEESLDVESTTQEEENGK